MKKALIPTASFWQGKRVFLTGHSGFKGAWLTLWLKALGAEVCGYSLSPESSPNLYTVLDIPSSCSENHMADIRDPERLSKTLQHFAPDLVIHMAAQSLVLRSYREPLATIATNIGGTANVLEACRSVPSLRGVLIVTTDKCYKNKEKAAPYTEEDELGGRDIYSASKACTEIITAAYRQSFFEGHKARVITARAGNVIGGGDWSEDRLIPDAARAFSSRQELSIRSPKAVRPWQHVAEPLLGYLMLARAMLENLTPLSHAYNFGPDAESVATVEQVIGTFAKHMTGKWHIETPKEKLHEATLLSLDSALAKRELGWRPCFNLEEAITLTANWYRAYYDKASAAELKKQTLAACEKVAGL